MHVAVVIVGYRNVADVTGCVEALSRSDYRDFEVVVCENGGVHTFDQLWLQLPPRLSAGQPVSVVQARANVGYAGGINIGMREARDADAWWVLNPDTEPHPAALSMLVERLSRGDCDIAGGILHDEDGRIQTAGGKWHPWLGRAVSLGRGLKLSDPPSALQIEAQLSFISGASMLVSRRFLQAVGPMREDYFLYAEEVEWCLRGSLRGMRFGFAPGAHVLHGQGATTGSAEAIRRRARLPIYLDERNRVLVTRDLYPARLPIAAAAGLAQLIIRFLGQGAWRQFGYAFAGWWAGLRGLRGPAR